MARGNSRSPSDPPAAASSDEGSPVVDPVEIDSSRDEGSVIVDGDSADSGPGPRKRRGRKPGSGSAKTAKAQLDLKGIEAVLVSTHFMLAEIMKIPELKLTQGEGAAMANAIANVARHYPVLSATQQTLDWIALGSILMITYGSRMAAYKARQIAERRKMAQAQNVVTPAAFRAVSSDPPLN